MNERERKWNSEIMRNVSNSILCSSVTHLSKSWSLFVFPSLLTTFFNLSPLPLLMILPRDPTGGTLLRNRLQCPTHCAHVIVCLWVYPMGTACRKYFDPSSVSRFLHMYSYVIFVNSAGSLRNFFLHGRDLFFFIIWKYYTSMFFC